MSRFVLLVTLVTVVACPPVWAQFTLSDSLGGEPDPIRDRARENMVPLRAGELQGSQPLTDVSHATTPTSHPENLGLEIEGNISYDLTYGPATGISNYYAQRITSYRTTTTGTLKLKLIATVSYPPASGTISSYNLGEGILDPLAPGYYYYDIYGTNRAFNTPPDGTYYISLMLMEYENGAYYWVDIATFANRQTFSTSPTTYYLDVSRTGSGNGSVVSSPSGINCPTTCTSTYVGGSSVTLTPFPASGSYFAGWSGACAGNGTCVVSMNSNKAVTATFNTQAAANHTLIVTRGGSGSGTVTSSPGGINCGADCSESYVSGTSVTLIASPSTGSTFGGWGGSCSGSGSCVVPMTGNKTVSASFLAAGGACTASISRICTQSRRFEVSISARDPRTGKTDSGQVMHSSDFFGYFAFPVLAGNTTDPQVFVKVLDGRVVNNRFWVFYASLTDNEFTLTVRDTQTGAVKTYRQQPYTQDAKNDTLAF